MLKTHDSQHATRPPPGSAFTLVEMMVAMSILGIVLTMALASWITILVGEKRVAAQNELDMDARTSMERLRADIRISDLNSIVFWPAGVGPYTAISFPVATASSPTNLMNNGGTTNIVWDRTVIYHIYTNTSPNELLRTIFYNRNANATVSNRQHQLNQVVAAGNGANACLSGETASTSLLFQNLFTWQITPNTAQFDCYADNLMRYNFLFGAYPLNSGTNTIEFRVIGKNPAGNTNRFIGIDVLNASASGADQEAEDQPFTAIGGTATVAKTYIPTGSWGGNYHLLAQCSSTQGVSVLVSNDCWTESNFQSGEDTPLNVYRDFDMSLTPWYHNVMRLEGATGLVWKAGGTGSTNDPQSQCNDCAPDNSTAPPLNVTARVLISGSYIAQSGKGPILVFYKSGDTPALINPTIAIANTTNNSFTCDAITGTLQNLVFYQDGQQMSWAACDWGTTGREVYAMPVAQMNVSPGQSYLVSYYMTNVSGICNMYHNEDNRFTNGCYILTNSATTCTANECWSTNLCQTTDYACFGQFLNPKVGRIYSLRKIDSGFATNGSYTSRCFDSGQLSTTPAKLISWSNSVPSNARVKICARTGNNPDCSDAPNWTNLTALTSFGNFANNTGRYIQFRADMTITNALIYPFPPSPRLLWVSFAWPGESRMIDIAGYLTRGPDYAQCQVTVNGQPLTRSIKVDLTIFKYVRTLNGGSNEVFTSFITEEIQPRNTGL